MERNKEAFRIYFCGSIRGGRQDASLYQELIDFLKGYGRVLTEHIGQLGLDGESHIQPGEIHDRDLNWLRSADVVVAEVTTPSLGVGYELGRAVDMGKPILCLYRKQEGRSLSAMISGSPGIKTVEYRNIEEAERRIGEWLGGLETKRPRD